MWFVHLQSPHKMTQLNINISMNSVYSHVNWHELSDPDNQKQSLKSHSAILL